MEMNMGKFSEKLVELLELAKKKKNVLEYQEINDFFKDQNLEVDQMEKVFDFLEASGVDAVSYTHLDVYKRQTQWGSKTLGDQGYSPIEILRYFYGDDMYINVAEEVSGVPASWPGYDLDIGAIGAKVRQLQEQINTISQSYPAVPSVNADGIYGQRTADAVRRFQGVFGLPETGITDYPTWYKIQEIYVAVSRIAELN